GRALAPRHVDPAGEAPIPGRHLVDQHVGRRIGRRVPDGDDGLVDALDDVAALLPRERAFRHVDLGYWHVELHSPIPSDIMPSVARCQGKEGRTRGTTGARTASPAAAGIFPPRALEIGGRGAQPRRIVAEQPEPGIAIVAEETA